MEKSPAPAMDFTLTLSRILDINNYKPVQYLEDEDECRIGQFEYKGRRLIIRYSARRARKDAADRERAVDKLRKKLLKEKNPKGYMSNYGNRKYLKIEGATGIELDEEKIKQAGQWDGLHGVVTNAENLGEQEILKQYNHLWEVENAFRITKHDLKVRPIFHWKPRRVKAHMAISFVAYTLVKHLEYKVKLQYRKMSPEQIRQCLVRGQTSILFDVEKRIRYGLPSRLSREARKIYDICRIDRKMTPFIIKKM